MGQSLPSRAVSELVIFRARHRDRDPSRRWLILAGVFKISTCRGRAKDLSLSRASAVRGLADPVSWEPVCGTGVSWCALQWCVWLWTDRVSGVKSGCSRWQAWERAGGQWGTSGEAVRLSGYSVEEPREAADILTLHIEPAHSGAYFWDRQKPSRHELSRASNVQWRKPYSLCRYPRGC